MGGGNSVLHRDENAEEFHPDDIKSLLKNRKFSDDLFSTIAKKVSKDGDGRINSSFSINVRNLVTYFRDDPNPVLKVMCPDKDVLVYAHKHVCEAIHSEKKAKEKKALLKGLKGAAKKKAEAKFNKIDDLMSENLSPANFFLLMSTIYMYSHIFLVFKVMDDMEIPDKRITKHEFLQARVHEGMKELKFLTNISAITEEEWEEAYNQMDTNGDGAIEFEEACKFCLETLLYKANDFIDGKDGNGTLKEGAEDDCPLVFESVTSAVIKGEHDGVLDIARVAISDHPEMNDAGALNEAAALKAATDPEAATTEGHAAVEVSAESAIEVESEAEQAYREAAHKMDLQAHNAKAVHESQGEIKAAKERYKRELAKQQAEDKMKDAEKEQQAELERAAAKTASQAKIDQLIKKSASTPAVANTTLAEKA